MLAAGVLLLVLSPGAARACDFKGTPVNGTLTGVLLETTEHVSLRPGSVREAHAREAGTLSNGCGTLTGLEGTIKVRATSWIPMDPTTHDLGVGPIAGSFQTGTSVGGLLLGSLDFGPTNSGVTDCGGGPCPFAWTSGTWMMSSPTPLVGSFTGVALIPFGCSLAPGWCYLDPTGTMGPAWTPIPVPPEATERRGHPEAAFVITLHH
ncbi:MAG TPA: hypothetical protein VGX21_18165 [Methylomirabilota bacterium]|jgi:hypothetical protein|nr:hypothetical protein [Methylomirabilota bacterium]